MRGKDAILRSERQKWCCQVEKFARNPDEDFAFDQRASDARNASQREICCRSFSSTRLKLTAALVAGLAVASLIGQLEGAGAWDGGAGAYGLENHVGFALICWQCSESPAVTLANHLGFRLPGASWRKR